MSHSPKEDITNKEGIVSFNSISEGFYLITISAKNIQIEKIREISDDALITIRLPLLFGKKELIEEGKIRNIYEKIRTDKTLCFKCKKEYKDWVDKFNCKYCGKFFCSNHRLPENHDCWGEPIAPPGGVRERHTSSGKIIATGV